MDGELAGTFAEFADIVASDDEPQPSDGPPEEQESPPTEAGREESSDLTPEERVAESLRQDSEDAPEEPQVAPEAEEPEQPQTAADFDYNALPDHIKDLIREGEEAKQKLAVAARESAEAEVHRELQADIEHARKHYASQMQQLITRVRQDAKQTTDPEAYEQHWLMPTIQGVQAAEEAYLGTLAERAQRKLNEIEQQEKLPRWAAYLAEYYQLPESAVGRILEVGDPNRMPARAEELAAIRAAFLAERQKSRNAQREQQARYVASQQVHPAATGRPRSAKPVQYVGSGDQGIRELRAIMSIKD